MTSVRAIETRYAGCHFRSRLEARWAVFFNTLGIRWGYEPEGFSLPSGESYLPDFHLPRINAWVEVKATLSPFDTKWREFHELTNTQQWMALDIVPAAWDGRKFDIPGTQRTFMVGHHPDVGRDPDSDAMGVALGPGSPHSGWAFVQCPHCYHDRHVEAYDIAHVAIPSILSCGHGVDPCDDGYYFVAPDIVAAYTAARSARFEHGQSGAA